MQVGDLVRIKPPFHPFFPDNYAIVDIQDVDGTLVYFLEGIDGAFVAMYLEPAV